MERKDTINILRAKAKAKGTVIATERSGSATAKLAAAARVQDSLETAQPAGAIRLLPEGIAQRHGRFMPLHEIHQKKQLEAEKQRLACLVTTVDNAQPRIMAHDAPRKRPANTQQVSQTAGERFVSFLSWFKDAQCDTFFSLK